MNNFTCVLVWNFQVDKIDYNKICFFMKKISVSACITVPYIFFWKMKIRQKIYFVSTYTHNYLKWKPKWIIQTFLEQKVTLVFRPEGSFQCINSSLVIVILSARTFSLAKSGNFLFAHKGWKQHFVSCY